MGTGNGAVAPGDSRDNRGNRDTRAHAHAAPAPGSRPRGGARRFRFAPPRFMPPVALLVGAACAMLAVYAAIILCGPIVDGHDMYSDFSHVDIWSAALRAGNPLSTWSPEPASGFGSPIPFFYHKLFNVVAASLTLATGDVVSGFRLAVFAFCAAMFAGLAACAAQVGASRPVQFVIATIGVLAPYAIAEMSDRSAIAEYSAMALLPAVLAATLGIASSTLAPVRGALLLTILLTLLAYAHVVIFPPALALAMAFGAYLIVAGRPGGWTMVCACAVSLAIFVVLIYVPVMYWAQLFNPDQAYVYGLPADNTVPLAHALLPFGRSWFGWPVTLLCVVFVYQATRRAPARNPAILAMSAVGVALILLTTHPSAALWRVSDLVKFVQFPPRLLALATPLMFTVFAASVVRMQPRAQRWSLAGLLAVTFVYSVAFGVQIYRHHGPIPLAELRHQTPYTGPGSDAEGEYYPAAYGPALARLDVPAIRPAAVLPARRDSFAAAAGGCAVAYARRSAYFETLRIGAACAAPGIVVVNQFSTPFLAIRAVGGQPPRALAPDAHANLITFALPAGAWTIEVRERGYLELVEIAWRARLQHGHA